MFPFKQDTMNRVRTHLAKIRHIQDSLRAFEARDRNIAEGNFVRVNYWSMIQIAVMLLVGLVQVRRDKLTFSDLWLTNKTAGLCRFV
jgi:protein ERP2